MYKYDETRNLIEEGYVDPKYVSPHCVVQVVEVLDKMRKHSLETYYHLVDVANLTRLLFDNKELGLSEQQKIEIYTAGLLHDVGKLAVPTEILHSKFDENSKSKIRDYIQLPHIAKSKEILDQIIDDKIIVDIAYKHHEKIDGSGYPRGLKGEEIDLASRIVQVADVTSAIMMPRSYRQDSMDIERASALLKDMATKGELDARVVDMMCEQIAIYNPTDEFIK